MKILIFLIVMTFMAVGMIRSIGIYGIISMELSILLLSAGGVLCISLFNKKGMTGSQVLTLICFSILFLYAVLISRMPSISILFSFFMLASSTLFIALRYADRDFFSDNTRDELTITDSAKLAFILFTTIHSFSLVFFYLFNPVRTTGLMDDYSQASMLLLLGYAMAYPLINQKPYFTAFSLLYFTAFFTTFSRTANFLLIVLFLALFLMEHKRENLRSIAKLFVVVIVALAFVYLYPSILGSEPVDRGGLSHFSSLNSRTIYWQTAWEAIQQKPLLGHGLGAFEYTGIKEAQPFHIIYFVHNDYLQIWHDLGMFWLILFACVPGFLLYKYSPFSFNRDPSNAISIIISDVRKYIAWFMLLIIALYMGINFLIYNIEFQLAIAIFFVDLLRK